MLMMVSRIGSDDIIGSNLTNGEGDVYGAAALFHSSLVDFVNLIAIERVRLVQ